MVDKHVVRGNAVDELVKASYEHDVVVVGSRGRGGFAGLLFGSTSQGLLQHTVTPVYVVPRKYVESRQAQLAAEKDVPLGPPLHPWQDVTGVEELEVPTASSEQAQSIDSTIDPEFHE